MKSWVRKRSVGELGLGADDGFDSGRVVAVPAGAGDEEGAAVVAVGASAEIGEVVGVEIDHLAGVVAVGLDLRHGDDEGSARRSIQR